MKRSFLGDWLIDGKPILSPDEGLEIKKEDIEHSDSGNDEGGYYHPIIQRFSVRAFSPVYSFLTAEEYDYMESLFDGKATFELTYPDNDGAAHTVVARCKRSSVLWVSSRSGLYRNYRLSILEC